MFKTHEQITGKYIYEYAYLLSNEYGFFSLDSLYTFFTKKYNIGIGVQCVVWN